MVKIRRALVSVSDKRNLELLAKGFIKHGIEIISTGGTARSLREAGAKVIEVATYTGAPEILDGRVKTLHPKIHGGLLGRSTAEHQKEMALQQIEPIDLVVVNLYPFAETISKPGVTLAEAIENIDIGGPSMIRSAAKNYERVTVIVEPDDYELVLEELDQNDGCTSPALRRKLARKVFAHTARYDGAIANFLTGLPEDADEANVQADMFPETLTLQYKEGKKLRYGENPHQAAAFYVDSQPPNGPSVAQADVLHGKELSYNNIVDLDAALQLVCEFGRPAVAIIKHTNPCGTAESEDGCSEAYALALKCDPTSAFGGIVAANRVIDEMFAQQLSQTFLECVIAPGFTDAARELLSKKKALRLLAYPTPTQSNPSLTLRSVNGGLLVQTADDRTASARDAKVVTKRAPTPDELRALDFAWRVTKHVKSNAIVLAQHEGTGARSVGVGAGQMSRVDSVRLAVQKAQSPLAGCVLGSDAFFPFRDGIDEAAKAGVKAIIQPGGSVRDDEVIAAADEHGIAMLFTGMRHFRH